MTNPRPRLTPPLPRRPARGPAGRRARPAPGAPRPRPRGSGPVGRPAEKRLVIGLARFDWEGAQTGQPDYQRRSAALRFERVNSFKCRGVNCSDKTAMLNLLAVSYEDADGPAGVVTLTFSGGVALRLEVECLECEF